MKRIPKPMAAMLALAILAAQPATVARAAETTIGKPVAKPQQDAMRNQHAELMKQQRILAEQRADRAALEVELADAVERYRALKHADAPAPAPAPPAETP